MSTDCPGPDRNSPFKEACLRPQRETLAASRHFLRPACFFFVWALLSCRALAAVRREREEWLLLSDSMISHHLRGWKPTLLLSAVRCSVQTRVPMMLHSLRRRPLRLTRKTSVQMSSSFWLNWRSRTGKTSASYTRRQFGGDINGDCLQR